MLDKWGLIFLPELGPYTTLSITSTTNYLAYICPENEGAELYESNRLKHWSTLSRVNGPCIIAKKKSNLMWPSMISEGHTLLNKILNFWYD